MNRINSRQKGARGERQWRDELRAHGYEARRGQQFAGGPNSPDVICEELAWMHFEVKAVERLNVYDAMDQAKRDGVGKVPVVAHRRSFHPWLVTMDAWGLSELAEGWLRGGCYFALALNKRLRMHETMVETEQRAKGRVGVLIHRRPKQYGLPKGKTNAWLVTVSAEAFFKLLRGEVRGVSNLQFQNFKNGTNGTDRTTVRPDFPQSATNFPPQ